MKLTHSSSSSASAIGITVNNLYKKLGPNQALDNVSMNFSAGLMHGLIGPEGAGKTTLLRTLIKLLTQDRGTICYTENQREVTYEEIRETVAYMPQQQSLYGDLSIDEHLEFFRELYSIPSEQYNHKREDLLRITRLDKFVDRPASKLSGGMYKKLGLMCSLLRSPRVLLLDEPTNGVDPISRREFWELLYRLSDQKILIIIATAYLDEAERCAQVHLLESGKFLAEGVPRELLQQEGLDNFDALFIARSKAQEVLHRT
ncbi:MAG: ABC transporter ATP-binding protein [Bdellovibrionales bacterium RIFOXYD12_FULL_39_22]|nr:MAG: ABC transporter ATP-binding protein [Bdellovibrionales bacterium RIFOXYB1_FULL_39_21]OFZ41999.1 MAG: ABC transporter ATP-binding protein [Bdellovibrionales bacterium RIFOXYC12_FULL_39_17]OFZ50715.1 MAG: ABC transporter ATP-binding protein [Bdellovibrionales bacterium RIFOXYC1_FULL_39_130]OFZ77938.1 MAG: ABC transporter ATP-binding protein [Bdellovibrionales bacterium RIFOXYD1_FULL_39_84]OFZ93626.1 MAG: ABC transporter ATP-binding protein [Bdellovibrionales bacterium RIFOXYD12_FULL_39_22